MALFITANLYRHYPLEDGDVIQIALAQEFIFLGQDATVPLAPGDFESSVISYFRRIRLEKESRRTWILNRELNPPLSALQFSFLSSVIRIKWSCFIQIRSHQRGLGCSAITWSYRSGSRCPGKKTCGSELLISTPNMTILSLSGVKVSDWTTLLSPRNIILRSSLLFQ